MLGGFLRGKKFISRPSRAIKIFILSFPSPSLTAATASSLTGVERTKLASLPRAKCRRMCNFSAPPSLPSAFVPPRTPKRSQICYLSSNLLPDKRTTEINPRSAGSSMILNVKRSHITYEMIRIMMSILESRYTLSSTDMHIRQIGAISRLVCTVKIPGRLKSKYSGRWTKRPLTKRWNFHKLTCGDNKYTRWILSEHITCWPTWLDGPDSPLSTPAK